jgi:hypothetical protein
MNPLRRTPAAIVAALKNCCRCAQAGERWDRIAGKAYCPRCQEALALGEVEPLRERTSSNHCSVCDLKGTVSFQTFPLEGAAPVEMDLCPEHLRGLLSRRLGPHAFHQLQRQLQLLDLSAADVFLLHEAFYDPLGRAQQPILELS